MPTTNSYLVPRLLAEKIRELDPPKSLEQIAKESGFRRLETLEFVLTGDIALPKDRVFDLAKAIGVSPADLFKLALKDWRLEHLAEAVLEAYGKLELSAEESELVALLRARRGSQDLVINDEVRAWIAAFPEAA